MYDDYSEKLFHQSQQSSVRDQSSYQPQYIGFNPAFSFSLCKVDNLQFQSKYLHSKLIENSDTDHTVTLKPTPPIKHIQINKIRKIRKIQTNSKIQTFYLKTKRGSPKETMQLNINFKTIFCQVIRDLINLKLLKSNQKDLFLVYKNQSPSFKSLNKFLDTHGNFESKKRLRQLVSSSVIIGKIQQSDLRMDNKMVMLKFLQVMRSTVIEGNNLKKWKK